MNLLSQDDLDEIKAGIKDVTDTFFTTVITYRRAKTILDRYGEGQNNGTTSAFEDFVMPCKVKYMDDEISRNIIGASSFRGVKLSFNADFWVTNNLYIDGEVKASQTKDYVLVNGKIYKVTAITPSGAFERRNLLITVLADLPPQKTV
jgi:hypothetical protein